MRFPSKYSKLVELVYNLSSRCSVLLTLAIQGREELEAGVQHGVLQHPQRSGADWLQSHHQLLLRHRTQEVRHEGKKYELFLGGSGDCLMFMYI